MSFAVCSSTGVAALPIPSYSLKHERLVAHDHAGTDVGGHFLTFEVPRNFRWGRTGVHVTFQVHVSAFSDIMLLQVLSQVQCYPRFVCGATWGNESQYAYSTILANAVQSDNPRADYLTRHWFCSAGHAFSSSSGFLQCNSPSHMLARNNCYFRFPVSRLVFLQLNENQKSTCIMYHRRVNNLLEFETVCSIGCYHHMHRLELSDYLLRYSQGIARHSLLCFNVKNSWNLFFRVSLQLGHPGSTYVQRSPTSYPEI